MSTVRVVWQLGEDRPGIADQLLADEVADVLGRNPDKIRVGRRCPRCGSAEHGRPVILKGAGKRPPHVSIARAPGVVVVAVSTEHPVGVDVERLDRAWPPGSTDLLVHAQEHHPDAPAGLTRSWVRKESLLKATGDGLHVEPALLRLSDPSEMPRLLDWPGGAAGTTALQDLEIDGYVACVAVLGHESVWVTQRQAASGSGGSGSSSSHAANSSRRS